MCVTVRQVSLRCLKATMVQWLGWAATALVDQLTSLISSSPPLLIGPSNSGAPRWDTHSHTSIRGTISYVPLLESFSPSSPHRVPVHCTHSRTAATTSMMRCGLRHTLLCLRVWTSPDVWTCGTSTMTLKYANTHTLKLKHLISPLKTGGMYKQSPWQ